MRFARDAVIWVVAAAGACAGQTKVNVADQTKNVDFSAAPETKPMKVGTALPATCNAGDMFLLLSAPEGSNVYACVAANVWSLQSGGSGGSGNVTLQENGTLVGSGAVENFVSGLGMINLLSNTGMQLDIQQSVDPAVVQTRSTAQSGASLLCASASGSATTYTCSMNPTLTAYTPGMVLFWQPDVSGAGGTTTVNIDTLGAQSVTLMDGVTSPTDADITAGRLYPIWFDGAEFRLMVPPVDVGAPGVTQPSCSVALLGRIWQVYGASGVKDSVSVCAKDATNTYAWRSIY